jgi:hypothetical protein
LAEDGAYPRHREVICKRLTLLLDNLHEEKTVSNRQNMSVFYRKAGIAHA